MTELFSKTLSLPADAIINRALLAMKKPIRKRGNPIIEIKGKSAMGHAEQVKVQPLVQAEQVLPAGPTTADFAALFEPKVRPASSNAAPAEKPKRTVYATRLSGHTRGPNGKRYR